MLARKNANQNVELSPVSMCRRQAIGKLLGGVAALGSASLMLATASGPAQAKVMPNIAQANILSYGADPTGTIDSTAAIMAAARALPPTGGSLLIPAGQYLCHSQINLPSINIQVIGDGQNVSQLIIFHNGIGLNFVSLGSASFAARELGFVAVGTPACAIAVAAPAVPISNTPTCVIENITLSVANGGGGFQGGVYLANVWRSVVRGLSTQGSGAPGSYMITLAGFSIDNHFENCTGVNLDVAFNIVNPCQGVHIDGCVVAGCNIGVSTSTTALAPVSNGVNILGLYISRGEFNCAKTALQLSHVWTGWISDTHFGSSGVGPTANIIGCEGLQISNVQFSGAGASGLGVSFSSDGNFVSANNQLIACTFFNLPIAIQFNKGVLDNWARSTNMINNSAFPNLQVTGVVNDYSGNSANQVEWLTEYSGAYRLGYLR